jgi:hypothetical protein
MSILKNWKKGRSGRDGRGKINIWLFVKIGCLSENGSGDDINERKIKIKNT